LLGQRLPVIDRSQQLEFAVNVAVPAETVNAEDVSFSLMIAMAVEIAADRLPDLRSRWLCAQTNDVKASPIDEQLVQSILTSATPQ
jgi:hypothetical protein